jgi:hypothetical protein
MAIEELQRLSESAKFSGANARKKIATCRQADAAPMPLSTNRRLCVDPE